MLVEINLLPQKERRKQSFILIGSGLLVIFLLIGGFYFWQIQSTKSEIANIERQIATTKKVTEAEVTTPNQDDASMSVSILKNAVEWANSYPIQTIPVMQHLTSLLPERGFIQTFAYTEAGTVSLTVQFDSAREAAYFLDSLQESEWIEEASLSSLNAEEKEEETTETTDTENQNSNAGTTETVSNEETNTSTGNNQSFLYTPDPNNPGSFIITLIDPNELNKTVTTLKNTETKEIDKILPRYIGQFEIIFNKEAIKKPIKGDSDEEGVTES
jgi:Tfp pilus assembly protein PilN